MKFFVFFGAVTFVVAICVFADINPYREALSKHPWQSKQKYVEIRPGVHIFYWLYYADGNIVDADRKPLIIWIQGGPGFAASGIANFAEIGPFRMDFQPRNHTWVKGRNVLLIDHPVGTGFSYASDPTLYVKSDKEMATDLSKLIKAFYKQNKKFRKTPTYIFGQSYGGKICPRLTYYLYMAIENKRLKMNLKGIGIGSGWVDPKESSLAFKNFLYYMGLIDQAVYFNLHEMTKKMASYIEKQQYSSARKMELLILQMLYREVGIMDINFNNINQGSPYPALEELSEKINKYVKPSLQHVVNQSLEWSYRSEIAYDMLNDNFLVPSTKFLEMILNETQLRVSIYNGNLDVVTPLAGASDWVHKLRWHGAQEFKDTKRIKIHGTRNGYYKTTKQLSFWWVFGSGHWVPEDNPTAMEQILQHTMSDA